MYSTYTASLGDTEYLILYIPSLKIGQDDTQLALVDTPNPHAFKIKLKPGKIKLNDTKNTKRKKKTTNENVSNNHTMVTKPGAARECNPAPSVRGWRV